MPLTGTNSKDCCRTLPDTSGKRFRLGRSSGIWVEEADANNPNESHVIPVYPGTQARKAPCKHGADCSRFHIGSNHSGHAACEILRGGESETNAE